MNNVDSNGQGNSSIRIRILAVFAIQGVVLAMLNMRIPDQQLIVGLSDGELGLVLMGGPVGALASFPLAARLVEKFGTRKTIIFSYIIMAIAAAGVISLPSGIAMFSFLSIVGITSSFSNIAINVEADRVEAITGSRIMNRCHGLWSIVFFAASTLAGFIRGAEISQTLHLWTLVPIFGLLTLILTWKMVEAPNRDEKKVVKRKFSFPTLAVFGLVAFGLGADLLEGASRVWATIYLRDAFNVSAFIESMALPALVLAMAVVRLVADGWIDRNGAVRVARVSLTTAFLGVLILTSTNNAWIAIFGFGLAGLGAGVIYPLMISGAARLGDRSAAENVAATTIIFQLIMLLSPVLIGGIAESFGVRMAYIILLPLLVIGWFSARLLKE